MNENGSIMAGEKVASSLGSMASQVKAPDPALLEQLMHRLSNATDDVTQSTEILAENANRIVGTRPEADDNRDVASSPCGGGLGEVFACMTMLERRIEDLRSQVHRFHGIA